MRTFLTTWSAITAIAVCPFFCLGESSGPDEAPRASCCGHCCGPHAPADEDGGDHESPCTSDCLCKGALPVKPPLELPSPAQGDMLPVKPPTVGSDGAPGDPYWNCVCSPRSPNDGGRGLRIALCSFLC